jgi:hypothetical protein
MTARRRQLRKLWTLDVRSAKGCRRAAPQFARPDHCQHAFVLVSMLRPGISFAARLRDARLLTVVGE